MAILNSPTNSPSPLDGVRLYVTRWVLSRGILVMSGSLFRRKGQAGALKDWYRLAKPYRDSFRHCQVALGHEAFLTLQEAAADATFRFATATAVHQTRTDELGRASARVAEGKLMVYDLTKFDVDFSIAMLTAFEKSPPD